MSIIAVTLGALCFAYAHGKGLPFSDIGKTIELYKVPVGVLSCALIAGVPCALCAFPLRQKQIWAYSSTPIILRITGLTLRFLFGTFFDIAVLPVAFGLVVMAKKWKSNFDPTGTQIKKDKIPILLIHGNDFNETEWFLGRFFLDKKEYGSVFTLNCDEALVRHDKNKGIDDYAKEKVKQKIACILAETKQNKIHLIGHSMGGLIAAEYAENIGKDIVENVITISTPWQGAPILETAASTPGSFKRFRQMAPQSHFLQNLNRVVHRSMGFKRNYYNIYSTVDVCVPNQVGRISGVEENKIREFTYLGHLGILLWPGTWRQICRWLNGIYGISTT